jgi:hypothetical protein
LSSLVYCLWVRQVASPRVGTPERYFTRADPSLTTQALD